MLKATLSGRLGVNQRKPKWCRILFAVPNPKARGMIEAAEEAYGLGWDCALARGWRVSAHSIWSHGARTELEHRCPEVSFDGGVPQV